MGGSIIEQGVGLSIRNGVEPLLFHIDGGNMLSVLSVVLQCRVVSNAQEPGLKTGLLRIIAGKTLVGFEQNILCDLLCFFWRRNQSSHHPQHLSGISASKLAEERCLSVKDATYEERLIP